MKIYHKISFFLYALIFLLKGDLIYAQSTNCATATVVNLTAGTACVNGTTVGAITDNTFYGTCNPSPTTVNVVWYTYVTNGSNNNFTITPGTLTNTEFILYSGGCPGTAGSVLETCGNANGSSVLSTTWGLVAGTQVWIGVASVAGTQGTFQLCISSTPPAPNPGNTCAQAIALCNMNPYTLNTLVANSSGQKPNCFANPPQRDVWFKFTITQNGTLAFLCTPTVSSTEFDWALWDVTAGCPGTIACCNYNYAAGSTNGFGMQASAGNVACGYNSISYNTAREFSPPISVTCGKTYALQISNYDNTNKGFTITWPGSTCLISSNAAFTASPAMSCGASMVTTITNTSTGTCAGETWDFGDGSANYVGTSPPAHTYTIPGTYAITATIAGTCPSTASQYVKLYGPLSATTSFTNASCPASCNGTASVSAVSGGDGVYTYSWAPGGQTTSSISGLCVGSYTVTISNATCGSTITKTVTIGSNPNPTVTVNSPTICNGTTATLTANGATSYTWSAGAASTGVNTATASPSTATTYTVTGTTAGCSSTAVSTVTVNPKPTVTVNSPTICAGTTANLTANGATSYTWSAGATSIGVNTATASPAATTSYTVTGTSLGCSNTAVSTVTIAPSLGITVNSPTICNGTTATLTANGGTTYTWTAGATSTGVNTATASPAATTSYTVTGTTGGCTGTAVSTVTVNSNPTVTVNSPTICNGTLATLTANGATAYTWTAGATSTGVNTATASPAATTTYTVTGTTTGCTGTAVSTVTVNPIPTITVNSPSICPSQTATLTANGGTSYTWSAGATSTGVNTATASPASTTSYTVTGTTSGCSSTAVATVTIGGTITVTVNSPTICNGQTATLTANGGTTYSWNTGSTANPYSVSPTTTTSYTVTGTAGGCSGTAVSTVTVNALPTMSTPANVTICNSGTVPTSAYSSTPTGATFDWTNTNTAIGIAASGTGNIPSFTATNTTTSPITATITVTPTLGCVGAPVTYTITVNPTPTLVITNPPAICTPGTVDITAASVTAGSSAGTFTYWTNAGATSSLASPNAVSTSGTYYIKLTSASGCTDIKPVAVTISPAPVLTTTNPAAVCAPGTVDITAAAVTAGSTGSGTLTYWTDAAASFGLASPNAVATSGTYYIQSMVGTCKDIKPVTVTINPKPTLVITNPAAVCAPGTVDITQASVTAGSTAGTLTYWTDAAGTASLASPAAVGTSGVYYIKTTTAAGCTDIKPVTVTINPKPTLVITDPAAVCAPGSVDITPAAVTAGSTAGTLTYWTNAAATTALASPNAVGTSGTYYIKVTTAAGCTDVKPVNVTISPTPVLTITNPAGVCSPTTVDITAAAITAGSTGSGVLSYWTDPAATNPLATPSAVSNSATYYILSTVGSCKDIKPVTVIINTTPALTITNPPAVCAPGSVDITQASVTAGSTGGGMLTYWTDAAATSSLSSPAAVATGGTYYIKTTTAAGCTDIKPVTVTINALPVLAITNPAAVCAPGTVDITAPAVTAGSTGGGTLTYWTDAAATAALATPASIGTSGTYYIKTTTAAGCTDTKPVTVTINPKPALLITNPAAVCAPGTVDIAAASVTAGSTGSGTLSYWTNPTATTALSTPNAVTTSGTYYIKTTTASGCTDIQPVLVTINPLPVLVITNPNAVCPPNTVNITATAVTAGSTGLGTMTYWSDAAGTVSLSSPNAIATSGTYYIKTTSAAGCSDIDPVTVIINPLPRPGIAFGPKAGCDPLCVNFVDSSSVSSGSINAWTWNFGDASSPAAGAGLTPSHCFSAGTYTVTVTDTTAAGCYATSTIPYVITVYPNPVASFSAPLSTSILSPTVQYTDESTIAAPGIISNWNWDFGDLVAGTGNTSYLPSPSHTFSDVGTYCANLIVTSTKGCKDTFDYCIVIDPEFTFFIPNAFSPNDDGINDEFYGKGDFIKTYEMLIYDRWGNMIFFTDDINKHWDGKANHGAEVAQQDVYVYVVKLTDNKDKKHKYIGTVTIVK